MLYANFKLITNLHYYVKPLITLISQTTLISHVTLTPKHELTLNPN